MINFLRSMISAIFEGGGTTKRLLVNPLYKQRSGVSLLIAVLLVSVIVMFSLIVSNVVVSSIRQSSNVNKSTQAYYAAEGAVEMALLANKNQGAGYTGSADVNYGGGLDASYTIQGQVPADLIFSDGTYGIPSPGSGDVGVGCDPLKPVIDSSGFWYSTNADPQYVYGTTSQPSGAGYEHFVSEDHPCNWNKLKEGEGVGLPLYVTTTDAAVAQTYNCNEFPAGSGSGVYICNPENLEMSSLEVRVRTACSDGNEFCAAGGRPDLFNSMVGTNDPFGGDDPIVSWQIVGTDSTGVEDYILQPKIDYIFQPPPPRWPYDYDSATIFESKINQYRNTGYIVLRDNQTAYDEAGDFGLLKDFLLNSGQWNGRLLFKPVLKLSVIHSLISSSSEKVPYVEYQILTNVGTALTTTNTSQTITAEGLSGEFKQVLEVKVPQESGLLEYVIQQ